MNSNNMTTRPSTIRYFYMALDILFLVMVLEMSIYQTLIPDHSEHWTCSPWVWILCDLSEAIAPGIISVLWLIKFTNGRLPIYYQATEAEKAHLEVVRTSINALSITAIAGKYFFTRGANYLWKHLTSDTARETLHAVFWLWLLLFVAVLYVMLVLLVLSTPWIKLSHDVIHLRRVANEELVTKIAKAVLTILMLLGDVETTVQMEDEADQHFR